MMKSKTVTLSSIRNVINKTATSNGRNKLNSNVAMSREIFHHLLKNDVEEERRKNVTQ